MWYRTMRRLARGLRSVTRPRDRTRSRLITDGGSPEEPTDEEDEGVEHPEGEATSDAGDERGDGADGDDGSSDETPGGGVDGSNVEVTEAGEAEPADPKWQKPDPEDIPEFEVRADEPVVSGGTGIGDDASGPGAAGSSEAPDGPADPTAGMPNTARAPGATRISSEGTEAYVAAVELCARLPDDVRLPEEAAELVPAAVEAELEQDVQQFAVSEFGAQRPHVDVLSFEDVDGEIWLRLRIGLPADDFADLDPEAVRSYALEQLEGVL